jgi:hypothetical protein
MHLLLQTIEEILRLIGVCVNESKSAQLCDYKTNTWKKRDYLRAVLNFVWYTRYVTLRRFVLLPAYCGTADEDQDNPPTEYLFSRFGICNAFSSLRHCATSRKVAVSISDGVTGIFH